MPACRAASNTRHVPSMFGPRISSRGASVEMPARCTTASTLSIAASSASVSRTSATTTSRSSSNGRQSRSRSRHSDAGNPSRRYAPIRPAAPVMRTRGGKPCAVTRLRYAALPERPAGGQVRVTESAGADNAPVVTQRRGQLAPAVRRRVRGLLLRTAARRQAAPGIRVLTYHLLPSPPEFRAHVEAVRSVGEIIDEDEFLDALENPDTLAAKGCRVLLTFDDGYRQHLIGEALDLVRDLELRPTVFMLAAGVDPTLGPPQRLVRSQRDR